MQYFILATSVIMEMLSTGILRNSFCKNRMKSNADLQMFNALSSVVTLLCLLGLYIATGTLCVPSMFTILLGIVFGCITGLAAIFNMKALEYGPLSYTKVIVCFCMIIPSLSGFILYGENITIIQVIGMVLMLISTILAIEKKKDDTKANIKWLVFCIVAFIFCGSIGVMQKIHQTSEYKNEISVFLLIAFSISSLLSFILVPIYMKKENARITLFDNEQGTSFIIITLLSGIGIAFCNHYNMYLSGVIDSMILFPILNGGAMILTTISGLIIWKEKLTKRQTIGLIVGIISILLLCNAIDLIMSFFS